MASKEHMRAARRHLEKHHDGDEDHMRAHPEHHRGGGEKVHFSGGKPGKGHNESPGSPGEGRKLTREEED